MSAGADIFSHLTAYFGDPDGFGKLRQACNNLPDPPPFIRIPIPEDGWSIDDLREFAQTCMGETAWLDEMLPTAFLDDHGMVLLRFEVDSPSNFATTSLFIGIQWPDLRWQIIPGLTVTQPELMIGIRRTAAGASVVLQVLGEIDIGGVPLSLSASLPDLTLRAWLRPGTFLSVRRVLEALHLDALGFNDLIIDEVSLNADVEQKITVLTVGMTDVWKLPLGGSNDVEVKSLGFAVQHFGGVNSFTTGSVYGEIDLKIGGTPITVSLQAASSGPDTGWDLSGSFTQSHEVGDVADAIGDKFGFTDLRGKLPEAVSTFTVSSFDFGLNTRTGNVQCACHGKFAIGTATPALQLNVDLTRRLDKGYDERFGGRLLLGGGDQPKEFDLIFDRSGNGTALLGIYQNAGGNGINLGDLIDALDSNVASQLGAPAKKLSFNLKDALFALVKGTPSQWLLSLDMDIGVELSGLGDLPLIGKALPRDSTLALAFQPVVSSSTPITQDDLTRIKALAPAASHLPDSVSGGFEFKATLRIGDISVHGFDLAADHPTSSAGTPSVQPQPDPPPDPSGAIAATPADVHWIDLHRHFGPLCFNRLGLLYSGGKIDVLLDASIALGPLDVSLMGLGAEYNLSDHTLTFCLSGLGIDFERGPVSVAGAFLRMGRDFAGEVMLKTETLALGALGAFGQYDGHPSLFIYAFVDYPLGGPSFFFVEGLSAGFGLNRRLNVPPISDIYRFPLVSEVIGGSSSPALTSGASPAEAKSALETELGMLEKYITPQLGQYFFCAGIRFTTFQQIDSFALVAVSAGSHFELDVIGLSKLKVPADSPEVLAEIDMEFAARLVPEEGVLGAQAQLTPQSYILSPDCRLQGGFAFSTWFLGEHAGDFVYTVGGYHPHFSKPAHYPAVPRVVFNWRVSDTTHVKGSMYYALTPGTGMAGGRLDASYESGSLRAWFTFGADFLIRWKPFHYDAYAYVEIGAAFTVKCFGTHHVSISASADLHVWGPKFAAKAHVSVKVMIVHVHFDVDVGNTGGSAPSAIAWSAFATTFLPAAEKVCSITATHGLVKTVGTRLIVNPKQLCIAVDSAVPCNGPNNPCGVGPVGAGSKEFLSAMTILVEYDQRPADAAFKLVPIVKNVPAALWKCESTNGALLEAVTGFTLHPAKPPAPKATHDIRDADLRFHVTPIHVRYPSSTVTYTPGGELAGTLPASPGADLLGQLGFDPATDVHLAAALPAAFVRPPRIATAACA